MSKQIRADELVEIVTRLLTNRDEDSDCCEAHVYSQLMSDIAEAVCNSCGGEVVREASFEDDGEWYVGVGGNDSLPEGGGVWAKFDPGGERALALADEGAQTAAAPGAPSR